MKQHGLIVSIVLAGLAFGALTTPPVAPDRTPARPAVFTPRPQITTAVPGYLDYTATAIQCAKWCTESDGLADMGDYGQSTKGKRLVYMRTGRGKPVLVTACIHGNEPLASSVVMAFAGSMLATYGKDADVTWILNNRAIYWVPVVSPDSYPNSREVDGVDPNRNFPGTTDKASVAPVAALRMLFLQQRFRAAISGHTYGRVLLTPWGDQTALSPNAVDYDRLTASMLALADGYRVQRACQMYGHPIQGSEVDWYYRQGAISLVWEFGTHQHVPSRMDVTEEVRRTYRAFLLFLRDAPEIRREKQFFDSGLDWLRFMDRGRAVYR